MATHKIIDTITGRTVFSGSTSDSANEVLTVHFKNDPRYEIRSSYCVGDLYDDKNSCAYHQGMRQLGIIQLLTALQNHSV